MIKRLEKQLPGTWWWPNSLKGKKRQNRCVKSFTLEQALTMLSTKWLGTPVVGDSCMTRQFCVNWRNGDRPRDVPGRDDTDSNQIRRLSGQECAACKLLPIWEPCQPQNQDRGSGQVWTVRWGLAHELARRPSWQIWTPPNLAFSAPCHDDDSPVCTSSTF